MLMMMRSDDTYTPTEGCSAEELLKCLTADDYDACVAACSEEGAQVDEPEEVKAGTLTVSMGDALADGTQIPNAGIVSFGTVKFAASSDDVNLKSVTIKKQGLVKNMANTKVWFEENGSRVSAKVSFNSDGEAIVSFAPAYTVKANKTAKFDLYVDLTNAGLGAGTDLSFASIDVDSSAETNKGSFQTPTLRTANYAVASVKVFDNSATSIPNPALGCNDNASATKTACLAAAGAWTEYAAADLSASVPEESSATVNGYEIANFTIINTSNNEDVIFNSITLKQEGTADVKNLSDIVLERNGEIVSKGYSFDGKYLTINVKNDKIEKGNNALYTVRAAINGIDRAADTYKFYLKNAEELNVVESTTDFRASLAEWEMEYVGNTMSYIPYTNLNTKAYTIKGGDVTFARDESLDLDSLVAAGSDVVLMQGTITTKESVTFENPVLVINNTTSTFAALSDLFTTLYLKIGNSVFSYTAGAEAPGATLKLDGTAVVNGKVNVKVYGTLKNTATPNVSIKLNALNLTSFAKTNTNNGAAYYSNNEVDVTSSIGSIAGNSITIEGSVLNMTRTDGLGATANVPTGNGNTIYKANITSQSTKGAKVTSVAFKLDATAPTFTLNQASTLTLYVDGKAVSTKNIDAADNTTPTDVTVTFNSLNFTVDKNASAEIEVKADIKEGTLAGRKIQLVGVARGLSYVDLASNRTNPTPVATIDGATISVVAPAGAVTLDSDGVDAKLLGKGNKDQVIAAIKVKATEGSVRLYNLPLEAATAGQFVNISNVRLTNESGDVIATATTMDNNSVTFTNLANTPFVEKDQTVKYNVVADINSNVTVSALGVKLKAGALANCLKSSDGGNVSVTLAAGTPVLHHVAKGMITVKQTSDKQGTDINNNTLTFTVKAEGADVLFTKADIIAAANLKLMKTGITEGTVKLYKNGTEVTAATFTVENGSEVELSVAYPDAVVTGTYDWNLSLVGLPVTQIDGAADAINLKDYKNTGKFPLTARK